MFVSKKLHPPMLSNAIYVEPPNKQRYVGREPLFEFFGGESCKVNMIVSY